jgi:hypothetical protein
MRRLVTVIAVLALVDVLLALGLWSTVTVSMAPRSEGRVTSPSAVEHLAELLAASTFRSLITNDYAPLNALIKMSAAWPEVAYLSVEDPQGRILGSTDPARVGQVWNDQIAAELHHAVGAQYREVVVAISNPADSSQNGVMGRVRLAYRVEATSQRAAQPSRPRPLLWIVLGLAALAAIPTGLIVVKVATTSTRPATTRSRSRGHRDEERTPGTSPRTLTTRHGSEERAR